ncbi:AEC family transporter [Salipiger sp. 1_MG-2023]|uniref:AEC family transporter n=1 Tax=Salipiger sp. 1_MG-2023 TaxID=3062665 RepID=UPI0026E30CA7|nr:AEC family transporter [Salipiger sp. 1_MG-2023]MDO6587516.1 AEC family transporter [Salipiger sp. 1_MG-2023]
MLHVLSHDILPVFALLALGFALGRVGLFSRGEAAAANRIAFFVMQPALIFQLVAGVPLPAFDLAALALYAGCEALCFALAYALLTTLFRRERAEAWLLAMCTVFVNSLLYVGPISQLIYGAEAALPVTAIVAWDASVTFALFIIGTELIAHPSAGVGPALGRIWRNPVLIAILAGILANAVGLRLPDPLLTAASFAGGAAAPLFLFALGIILSQQGLRPSGVVIGVTSLKLLAFPAMVFVALGGAGISGPWHDLLVLTAAGPSGAMAFSLAMLHGIRTDAIAPVIIWTSVLSLLSLAALA